MLGVPSFLFLLEELLEEFDLITDGVVPILAVMSSGTEDKIVSYLLLEETFVDGFVYAKEEIVYTAIDDDGQITVLQTTQLVDDCVVVPYIIDCGVDDFFFGVNKAVHERLLLQKVGHDFIARPGGHTRTYWNNSIGYQIKFFKKFFDKE